MYYQSHLRNLDSFSYINQFAPSLVYAGYGVYSNVVDITTIVNGILGTGRRNFTANDIRAIVPDPAVGERKYLFAVWDQGGQRRAAVIGEDDPRGIYVG